MPLDRTNKLAGDLARSRSASADRCSCAKPHGVHSRSRLLSSLLQQPEAAPSQHGERGAQSSDSVCDVTAAATRHETLTVQRRWLHAAGRASPCINFCKCERGSDLLEGSNRGVDAPHAHVGQE